MIWKRDGENEDMNRCTDGWRDGLIDGERCKNKTKNA